MSYQCEEISFMRRCLQLARQGCGRVSPNPMVGAVVVADGKIVGEGYHALYGEAHAEVNAIASVADDSLFARATLYVSLEPCSHYGKTPPCSELIIRKGIRRVVVGTLDPFPMVAGRGVAMMREAGVEVTVGLLEQECRLVNAPFFTYIEKRRPHIILKWAQTADGFIDVVRAPGAPITPTRISDDNGRRQVHKLRAECDAILVGTNTALVDNPSLTVRFWHGKHPLRIVFDRHHRLPLTSHLLDDAVSTVVFSLSERPEISPNYRNICWVVMSAEAQPLQVLTDWLYEQRVKSLLVEGGAQLLQSFIDAQLYDDIRVEVSTVQFGQGVPAPVVPQ